MKLNQRIITLLTMHCTEEPKKKHVKLSKLNSESLVTLQNYKFLDTCAALLISGNAADCELLILHNIDTREWNLTPYNNMNPGEKSSDDKIKKDY